MPSLSKPKLDPDILLNKPVASTLWSMTWPMFFGIATLISFNVVDTLFISLLGTQELAAVGFTFPVTFTIISLSIGLGIGTSAVIAKQLGAKHYQDAKDAGSSALYLSGLLVLILASLFFLANDAIFQRLGASPELMPIIHDYMYIWYLGAPLLVVPMVGNSILRAAGDTKTPSLIMGLGGLCNAVLDPLLIFGLGPFPALGVKGAAVATLISWVLGFLLIFYWLVYRRKLIAATPPKWASFSAACRRVLAIGLPAAGANMMTPLAMGVLTALVALYGAEAVAAFSVGSRLESLAILGVLTLSMTLPPFLSQNYGAGQLERVISGYKIALYAVLIVQLAVYLILILASPAIQYAFAREQEVADVLAIFLWILPLGYGAQGWIILTNSAMNALHLPSKAFMLSVIRLFATYVPFAYAGHVLGGLTGLFIGAVLANIVTAALSYVWFMRICEQKQVLQEAL